MCKHSNVFSRPVLIARGLDLKHLCTLCSFQESALAPALKFWRSMRRRFSVALAEGVHLFPFRTEKLSPPAPMVLQGKPCGRVGRRRIIWQKGPLRHMAQRAFRVPADCLALRGQSQCRSRAYEAAGAAFLLRRQSTIAMVAVAAAAMPTPRPTHHSQARDDLEDGEGCGVALGVALGVAAIAD